MVWTLNGGSVSWGGGFSVGFRIGMLSTVRWFEVLQRAKVCPKNRGWYTPLSSFLLKYRVETIQIFQRPEKGGSKWRSISSNLHRVSTLPGICILGSELTSRRHHTWFEPIGWCSGSWVSSPHATSHGELMVHAGCRAMQARTNAVRPVHRFSQKWQLRVCKWNFRVCKMPFLMKIPMKMKEFGWF